MSGEQAGETGGRVSAWKFAGPTCHMSCGSSAKKKCHPKQAPVVWSVRGGSSWPSSWLPISLRNRKWWRKQVNRSVAWYHIMAAPETAAHCTSIRMLQAAVQQGRAWQAQAISPALQLGVWAAFIACKLGGQLAGHLHDRTMAARDSGC